MNSSRRIPSFWGIVPVLVVLGIWEISARLELIPGGAFFPAFSEVVAEIWEMIAGGVLLPHFLSSLGRVMAGFVAGSVAGILLGIWMGWSEHVHRWCRPIISLLYPIPALGWLPVLMLWVGVNEMLPIAIIFICSFFPVLYNTVTGIRQVPKDLINFSGSWDSPRCTSPTTSGRPSTWGAGSQWWTGVGWSRWGPRMRSSSASKVAVFPAGIQVSRYPTDTQMPNRFLGRIFAVERKPPLVYVDLHIQGAAVIAELSESLWDESGLRVSDTVHVAIPMKWIRTLAA